MKNIKINRFIILISFIIIGINLMSFYKYDYIAKCTAKTEIAQAIIYLEKDENIEKKINKENFPIEYNFCIKNYDGEKVNEIDFEYTIEVHCSNDNFPITYDLIDCNNNKVIQLYDGKSNVMNLDKYDKVDRNFKLYLQWRETDIELSNKIDIDLIIDAVQRKE